MLSRFRRNALLKDNPMLRRLLLALPLLGLGSVAHAQGCDTTFSLANRSGSTVNEFYFNPANNPNWGPDRLGDGVLANGRQRTYTPSRGGRFDFRVVWQSGEEAEIRNIDICSTSTIVATRSGIIAE
jgi:hypothetical protein